MSPRVAVTGANGFIGQTVVRHFRDAGWDVRAIIRSGRQCALPDGVALVPVRFTASELARAAQGSDVVVHTAGLTRAATAGQFQGANVEVTREVTRAAAVAGARLVHISSQAAAGPGTPEAPRHEDDPPSPLTAYGRSKLAGEEVVRASRDLAWTILRPGPVYGPADRAALPLFRLARRGIALEVRRDPAPAYTFIHVDDVARGIVAAATSSATEGQVFALGHPESVTAMSLSDALARALGRPFRRVRIPYALLLVAAVAGDAAALCGTHLSIDRARLTELMAPGWVFSVEKARERLGFTARVSLVDGLADTAAWYTRHGWLPR
jgi:nucleoside-diphosphate-sugar epimerase